MTISTTATLSTLRPKNMRQLYANQTVYLCCKGGKPRLTGLRADYDLPPVLHLLWGVRGWLEIESRFGDVVAEFDPHRKSWTEPRICHADERMNLKELAALVAGGEICMLGKNCPKHRGV